MKKLLAALAILGVAALIYLAFQGPETQGPSAERPAPVGSVASAGCVIAIGPDGRVRAVKDGLDRPTSMALAPDGSLVISQHGGIIAVNPADGTSRTLCRFDRPWDLAAGPEGKIYIAGQADAGQESSAGVFTLAQDGSLSRVFEKSEVFTEIAVSPKGEIWLANYREDMLRKAGKSFVDSREIMQMGLPTDLAFGPDGIILVSLLARSKIVRVNPDKEKTETVVSNIAGPNALAVDAAGRVFIGSLELAAVLRFDPDGTLHAVAQGATSPQALAIGADGTLYILNGAERPHEEPPGSAPSKPEKPETPRKPAPKGEIMVRR